MLSHKSIAKKSQNCQEKFVVDFFQKISYNSMSQMVAKNFLAQGKQILIFCPSRGHDHPQCENFLCKIVVRGVGFQPLFTKKVLTGFRETILHRKQSACPPRALSPQF